MYGNNESYNNSLDNSKGKALCIEVLSQLIPVPAGSVYVRIQPPGFIPPDEELYVEYLKSSVLLMYAEICQSSGLVSQLSQGFVSNGNPDISAKTFFIAQNYRFIGFVNVSFYNDHFSSSSGFFLNDDIDRVIENSIPIAVVQELSGFTFVQTECGGFHLVQHGHVAFDFWSGHPSYAKEAIVFTPIHINRD